MKREFLKGLNIEGLTDEIIENIMKENGKDIEATKAKSDKSQELENLKSELESNKQTLEQANAQIEKFKGLDVEGIKAQAEEWKNKYSEFELKSKADKEAYEKQLADQNRDFKIKELLSTEKFSSNAAKKAFEEDFKKQGLTISEDGTILGANDFISKYKESDPGAFVVEAQEGETKLPEFTKGTSGTEPKSKMSVIEWMKAKNANPNLQLPDEF